MYVSIYLLPIYLSKWKDFSVQSASWPSPGAIPSKEFSDSTWWLSRLLHAGQAYRQHFRPVGSIQFEDFSPNRVALRSSWGSHGWLEDFHCACGQIRVLRSTGPNQEPVWKVHNTLQLYHFLCRGPSYAQRQIFWASMVPWDVDIFGSGMAYRARQPSASMASKSVKTRQVCSKCPSQLWKLCRSL